MNQIHFICILVINVPFYITKKVQFTIGLKFVQKPYRYSWITLWTLGHAKILTLKNTAFMVLLKLELKCSSSRGLANIFSIIPTLKSWSFYDSLFTIEVGYTYNNGKHLKIKKSLLRTTYSNSLKTWNTISEYRMLMCDIITL